MSRRKKSPEHEERDLEIRNRLGLHARAAALFVQTASEFNAEIRVKHEGQIVDGKSILGLMMLAAGPGTTLRVVAEGSDASDALDALEQLFDNRFHEDG